MRTTKETNTKHKIPKTNNGITLIALVITIIVMLVLVAVTITMAVNGGLFDYAQKAVGETKNAINKEQTLADGRVNIDGVWYDNIDAYIKNTPSANQEGSFLPYDLVEKDTNGFLTANAKYTSGGYTAVIPKGFKISEVEGEDAITTGLVIKDASNNEFVWIPVTKTLENSYSYATGYLEPATVAQDVDYGAGTGVNFTASFESEYNAMVTSVNNNDGFYIGRCESTIGRPSGGYMLVTAICGHQMFVYNGWYDLYNAQKRALVEGNGTNVQTAMIYGVLWDETMAFITQYDTNYNVNAYPSGASLLSQASSSVTFAGRYTDSNGNLINAEDVALNIFGLASNRAEWTQESVAGVKRTVRGAISGNPAGAAARQWMAGSNSYYIPLGNSYFGSRMIMYIL